MATWRKIKELIDNINTQYNRAVYLEALRKEVGWKTTTDNSAPSVSTLIEKTLICPHCNIPYTAPPQPQLSQSSQFMPIPDPPQLIEDLTIYDVPFAMRDGRGPVYQGVELIINSGWDFKDQFMHKSPEEVKDFLESCLMDTCRMSEMHPNRQAFLKTILNAFQRWLKTNQTAF